MRKNKPIEFSALRIFAAVAESETFTLAAQRLGITQSGVSQSLKQLEEQTGVTLIEKKRSRPIKLTPSGQVLKGYADNILADTSRMQNDIRMASRGRLPSLRVGMIDSFGDALGLHFITQVKSHVSKVALLTGLNTSLTQALIDRDIDFLITSDSLENEPNIVRHSLIRDPFLVIAPEESLSNDDEDIKKIAAKLPFIHYNPTSQIGKKTDLIARRMGIELHTQYELDSTQTLVRFVQANQGWAITSALCLSRYPNLLDGVRVINLNNGSNARFISQTCRRNELGEMPGIFADISRKIFTNEVVPKLIAIAPWLEDQAYEINALPDI